MELFAVEMYTKKKHTDNNQLDSDTSVRKIKNSATYFEDTRPEALQLKKMQEMIDSGSHPVQFQRNSSAPIQRMPDWLAKLLIQIGENKLESLALAAAAGFAGVLAYYYFKGNPTTRAHIEEVSQEEEEPDFSTLEGVAKAIGISPRKLLWQLETAPSIDPSLSMEKKQKLVTVNDLYQQGFDGTTAATGVVPPSLLENLPPDNEDKLEELFRRFNNLDFQYLGSQANGASGFLSRQGDCATLTLMFMLAAEACGIDNVEMVTDPIPMLVPGAPIHGRNSQRNVYGQNCWAFIDHHWCTYKGRNYDLLFMNEGPEDVVHRKSGHIHNGVTYYIFEDERAIIYDEMVDHHLTFALTKGYSGCVFTNYRDAELFIDRYKK